MTEKHREARAALSPSVHEAMIARYLLKDDDDTVLQSLHDAVKAAREAALKARDVTSVVLGNEMETPAARHKKSRSAGFELLHAASTRLDAALRAAHAEVVAITTKVKGPPPPKDQANLSRQMFMRDELRKMPAERRSEIIADALKTGDDFLVSAVLDGRPWETGLTQTELDLCRHNWAARRYPADLDRLERIQKAVADSQRAGELTLHFVDGLTDPALIAEAEAKNKRAADALAAAKG